MTTEAQKKATEKYQKENIARKVLKLNKTTDADIIAWLDKKDNINGYLKDLIREDRIMTKKMVEETRARLIEMELDSIVEAAKVTWVGDKLENCVGEVRPVTVEGVESFLVDGVAVAKFTFEVDINEVRCSAEPTLGEVVYALDSEPWMENAEYTSVTLADSFIKEEQERILEKEIEKLNRNRESKWEIEEKRFEHGWLTARLTRTAFEAKCATPEGFAGKEVYKTKEITVYKDLTVEII